MFSSIKWDPFLRCLCQHWCHRNLQRPAWRSQPPYMCDSDRVGYQMPTSCDAILYLNPPNSELRHPGNASSLRGNEGGGGRGSGHVKITSLEYSGLGGIFFLPNSRVQSKRVSPASVKHLLFLPRFGFSFTSCPLPQQLPTPGPAAGGSLLLYLEQHLLAAPGDRSRCDAAAKPCRAAASIFTRSTSKGKLFSEQLLIFCPLLAAKEFREGRWGDKCSVIAAGHV